MNSQTLPFSIKSVSESGVVEGVISAFGQVDHVGDTIERGAYSKVPGWGRVAEGVALVSRTHAFFLKCRGRTTRPCAVE